MPSHLEPKYMNHEFNIESNAFKNNLGGNMELLNRDGAKNADRLTSRKRTMASFRFCRTCKDKLPSTTEFFKLDLKSKMREKLSVNCLVCLKRRREEYKAKKELKLPC